MKRFYRPIALVVTAALLMLGFDLATYARTGDSLVVGKVNRANKVTKLQRTKRGPVLELKSKGSSPPLKVSSKAKVAKLNADLLDGLSAAALQTTARTIAIDLNADAATFEADLPLAPGSYLVSWSATLDVPPATGDVLCALFNESTGAYVAGDILEDRDDDGDFIDVLSASGLVRVASVHDWEFLCTSPVAIGAFTGNEGIVVTLVRLSSNPAATVVAGPPA